MSSEAEWEYATREDHQRSASVYKDNFLLDKKGFLICALDEWYSDWYDNSKSERLPQGTFSRNATPSSSDLTKGFRVASYSDGLSNSNLTGMVIKTPYAPSFPKMIHVDGGSFDMDGKKVTVKSFSIAKTETTVLQWKTFCKEGREEYAKQSFDHHADPDIEFWWRGAPTWGWIDNHPIVDVSWDESVAYCKWLSIKTGKHYRLPTAAEWEYAARGGSKSKGYKYSGGDSLDNVGWYKENSGGQTHPVAQKQANELGLYDMSGNVWEWCKDKAPDYMDEFENLVKSHDYIIRGNSWKDWPDDITSEGSDVVGRKYIGFRVVCSD